MCELIHENDGIYQSDPDEDNVIYLATCFWNELFINSTDQPNHNSVNELPKNLKWRKIVERKY